MTYKYLHLLDKWGELFKKNKASISKMVTKHQLFREDKVVGVQLYLNSYDSLFFTYQLVVYPNETYAFEGKGFVPGNEKIFFEYVYLGKLMKVNGEVKTKRLQEIVILFDNGERISVNPAIFVADTVDGMIMDCYQQSIPGAQIESTLNPNLLEEILAIQLKVMEAERDTNGIVAIQKQFNELRKGEER